MVDEIKQKIIIDGINHLFRHQRTYCICTVNDLMKIAGSMRTKNYDALHIYHCREYASIPKDIKAWLYEATVSEIMGGAEFPEIQIVQPPAIEVDIKPGNKFLSWVKK